MYKIYVTLKQLTTHSNSSGEQKKKIKPIFHTLLHDATKWRTQRCNPCFLLGYAYTFIVHTYILYMYVLFGRF